LKKPDCRLKEREIHNKIARWSINSMFKSSVF
jgi:hypothetical protein